MTEEQAKAALEAAGWTLDNDVPAEWTMARASKNDSYSEEQRKVWGTSADQARALLVASVQQTARAEKLEGIIARAVARMNTGRCNSKAIADTLAILKEADNG